MGCCFPGSADASHFPHSATRPATSGGSPASTIRRLSRVGIAFSRRFERLRFDWRNAPVKDTLPRVVSGRGVIIAAVLALWIAMTAAWGWGAGMAFAFFVAVALVRLAGVIVAGPLIQQAGHGYYERQLRGRRRA
jgi:fatty acid desaturase